MFRKLQSVKKNFKRYLNQFDVIHLDIQWCMMDAKIFAKYIGFTEEEVQKLCKKYPESLKQYTGKILLVGINYDKKTRQHECIIEKLE